MNSRTATDTGTALWIKEKSHDLDNLLIDVIETAMPTPGPGQVIVEIKAAGVNPSDVKASLGHMPQAIWPRTPGRDYAGVVVEGPDDLIGTEVWGGGGELGITQNGSHARFMALPKAAVRAKPASFSFEQAGSVGVPFITAFEGLKDAGWVQPWDTVAVGGANGKVGQAVIQMATLVGAKVFALVHRPCEYIGHANADVEVIDISQQDAAAIVREKTGGKGADIFYNTMGSPYFECGNAMLAKGGRHIFIATLDRAVDFDIFTFYRGKQRFIGVDSLGLSSIDGAKIFETLKPLFEDGRLKPFPINPDAVYSLDDATEAYASVLRSTQDRVILRP
ncbi:MAG: zinc-binding alcohol dehydrogenase family protein [Octadecabacter sp.]|jgi:NADPH2:quinone reductase|nr:zinc-binding alcohol dehydrogenase family protein [bacterium]